MTEPGDPSPPRTSHRRPGNPLRRRALLVLGAVGGVALLVTTYLAVTTLTGRPTAGGPSPSAGPSATPAATATPTPDGERGFGTASPSPAEEPAEPPPPRDPPPAGGDSACAAFPSFPDAGCTGWEHTGVTLRDCPTTVTEAGATLDRCRFPGGVTIQAADVTISRSLIHGLVEPHDDLRGLTLVDVEIDGTGQPEPHGEAAIGNGNYTCIRCHIHSTGRGANLDNNVHIEDSYLHGFVFTDGVHQTAIGSNGGSGFTIRHNNLECSTDGCSAALSLYGDFFPIEDVLIERNLFNTTGSFCTYAGSVPGKPFPVGSNIRYVDNRFGTKYTPDCGLYGPVTSWEDGNGNVWQGNAWQDGGAVAPAAGP